MAIHLFIQSAYLLLLSHTLFLAGGFDKKPHRTFRTHALQLLNNLFLSPFPFLDQKQRKAHV